MNQQPPVIKGWILHGINNERAEIKAVCGTAATSHESGRVLIFLSLLSPLPPQAPAPPHGSPESTTHQRPGASGRSPGARADWRLFSAGPTASIRPYQMQFRWPLFSCKGQWLLPDDRGVVQTPRRGTNKKKGEKKRKPHAALSLCHQILQSNESMASSSLGHHRLVRPTSESSPEFLSGLSSLLTR